MKDLTAGRQQSQQNRKWPTLNRVSPALLSPVRTPDRSVGRWALQFCPVNRGATRSKPTAAAAVNLWLIGWNSRSASSSSVNWIITARSAKLGLGQWSPIIRWPIFAIRGDPFITFAPRGGGGLEKWPIMRTIVLIGCVKCEQGGEGVQNPENFVDILRHPDILSSPRASCSGTR